MPRLRSFQREDVDYLKKHRLRALVANAPGTGKTATAIRAIAETHQRSLPAVVICPASVVHNWVREFKVWAPGIPVYVISTKSGSLPKAPHSGVVYILSWALLDAWSEAFRRVGVQTIVADEAHYALNPEALRSQALQGLAASAPGVLLLTGTPIVNSQRDLDALYTLLGSSSPPMIRRLIEDVAPDIPEKKRSLVHVKLRPPHQAEYDRADKDFETWLLREKAKLFDEGLAESEVERALASEALIKIGYLRRLVGEYKVPAATDWIARAVRLGEPVVVFLEHQATLTKLTSSLRKQRIRFGVLEGSTTTKQRQRLVDAFQQHKFPVFIGTRAAKEGITLTAARHLLFLERFFTSSDEEQAEDRIRRIGQRYKTTAWYLHAQDTIDERIAVIVDTKRTIIRTAIGAADTAETPTSNVVDLLRSWSTHAAAEPGAKAQALGLGDPLPPLPSPRVTHALVFSSERWTPKAALVWCRMHGYRPEKRVDYEDRFKFEVHPAAVFEQQSFHAEKLSRHIKALTGRRVNAAKERKIRRASLHRR